VEYYCEIVIELLFGVYWNLCVNAAFPKQPCVHCSLCVSILGFDDISLNSWTICLSFGVFQRQLVGEGDKKVVVTICDRYGPRFLYKPVMTDYDRFFAVFFGFGPVI
jgi:hypothetical protein